MEDAIRSIDVKKKDGPYKGKGGGKGPVLIDPATLPKVDTIVDKLQRQKEQEAAEKAKMAAAELAQRAEVARLMETLTPVQVLHILGEMQRLTLRAPDVARALLAENSQLSLALQHAQFLAGMLEDSPVATEADVREHAKAMREKIWGVTDAPAPGLPAGSAAPVVMPGLPPGVVPLMVPGQTAAFMAPPAFAPLPMGGVPMALAPGGPTMAMPGQTIAPMSSPLTSALPGVTTEEQRRAALERMAQLSPTELEQLPHGTKVQLLEYLKQSNPQQKQTVKVEPGDRKSVV